MKVFEIISPQEMMYVKRVANMIWKKFGVEVIFTTHFLERVNDERNGEDITVDELVNLFQKACLEHGKEISDMSNSEAVLRDMFSQVNIPFLMKGGAKSKTKRLVTKSVMRTPDFKAYKPFFNV